MSEKATSEKRYRPVALKRDHARPRNAPQPSEGEIAARLEQLFHPATLALSSHYHQLGLRWRILSLPVMVAVLLSAIWRSVPSVNALLQMLVREPLLWVAPTKVSQQALNQRLRTLPASLFGEVLAKVLAELLARSRERSRPLTRVVKRALAHFEAIYIADATTLEELFKKVGLLRGRSEKVLGGKLMVLLDLASKLPAQLWLDEEPECNEKAFLEPLKEVLRPGVMLIVDRGFYSFAFFDWLTEHNVGLLSRARELASFQTLTVMHASANARDRIIKLGVYRSNPCENPLRLVEVYVAGVWHRYLTNVLDPCLLPAADVVALYAQRWRIEESFSLTKRLLGLSYLWTGAYNGIAMQVYATWMFYSVLADLSDQVAQILGRPLDDISLELVYRGLYHYSTARGRGLTTDPATYLAAQTDLGIVKAKRPRLRHAYLDELPAAVNL
jgi:hypothetical protein